MSEASKIQSMLDRLKEGKKVLGVCDLESVFQKRVHPLKDLREWQVSDRLILVGYASFIGDFPEGLQSRYAPLLKKTILFFGQVAQKGELAPVWIRLPGLSFE